MAGIHSIEALQSTYKHHNRVDVDKPTVEELLNKVEVEPINKEVEPINKVVESVEEMMLKLYEQKEIKANEDYNTKLYKNPTPLTDEEKSRAKWRNGRRYLNY